MNHLDRLRAELTALDVDALLITGASSEYYAVGFRGEGVALLTETACVYCTDSRYIEAAQREVTGCELVLTDRTHSHKALTAAAVERLGCRRLGYEDETMTVRELRLWQQALGEGIVWVPVGDLFRRLRVSKDAQELARMEQAQRIADRAFTEVLNHIRPGVTEQEIAAWLTFYLMKCGGSGNSFDPIVAAGPNGSMPHAVPTARPIQKGDFVTLDFGCIYDGYCSDTTRTVAVGQPTEEMERVYQVVAQAQRAGIALVRAGVIGAEVHAAGEAVIAAAGYGDYFGHGFGHSLGLEIHEDPGFRPASRCPIPAGAVVSAEPGIYLPGRFGVRIEDVVVVEETGCRILSKLPKELLIL